MKYILVPAIIVMMIMAAVSLGRGIVAFLNSTREDLNHTGTGPTANQLKQNKMMMNRILFQGAAIVLVAVLLFASR